MFVNFVLKSVEGFLLIVKNILLNENKPTYIQFFDDRLTSEELAKNHKEFIETYDEVPDDIFEVIPAIPKKGEKLSDPFNKLVWTFTAMLSVILAGFIAMLYF